VDTFALNAIRTAKVWLDEFQEKFFDLYPEYRHLQYGNITDRLELRKRLNCKSFHWYLETIYPELLPGRTAKSAGGQISRPKMAEVLRKYRIRLKNRPMCLGVVGAVNTKGSRMALQNCDAGNSGQLWQETSLKELRLSGILCLDSEKGPRLMKCDYQGAFQAWNWLPEGALFNGASGQCLHVASEDMIEMNICDTGAQQWLQIDLTEAKDSN